MKKWAFVWRCDIAGWKKSKQDDLDNMKTGIFGKKGEVHYEAAPCINDWLDTLPSDMPKQEIFSAVAKHIDSEIHSRYRIYPGNWIALDELDGTPGKHADKYSDNDLATFEAYITERISKIKMENPDVPSLSKMNYVLLPQQLFHLFCMYPEVT